MGRFALYEMKRPRTKNERIVDRTLEQMRCMISREAGVTLVGNRLTIRWGDPLRHVHMIIEHVEHPEISNEYEFKRQ